MKYKNRNLIVERPAEVRSLPIAVGLHGARYCRISLPKLAFMIQMQNMKTLHNEYYRAHIIVAAVCDDGRLQMIPFPNLLRSGYLCLGEDNDFCETKEEAIEQAIDLFYSAPFESHILEWSIDTAYGPISTFDEWAMLTKWHQGEAHKLVTRWGGDVLA